METGLTASDVALLNGNDGFMGGGGAFWIFALLILANGGFGFGNRGGEQYATSADVQRGFDTSEITRKIDALGNGINDATYALDNTIRDSAYGINANITNEGRNIQTQMANGFCDTQKNIDGIRFDMANYMAQANQHSTELYMKLHDELAQNKIETLQGRINQLELQNAVSGVVRYPQATTYASSCNPFSWGCGCSNNI